MDILNGIAEDIRELLQGYVSAESCTGTPEENSGADFFIASFKAQKYFVRHPEHLIKHPVPDDPLGRSVCCAMLRGMSEETVVMMHHYDVTDIEDYGRFAELAYRPAALDSVLKEDGMGLEPEAAGDLNSGDFMFGHGVCDMKGGGCIQMALLSRLAEEGDFHGTLMVLAVPDEENLSAGMREAVALLRELKDKYGLNYRLMINSEPHLRKEPHTGMLSIGSIGKLLPFVYSRGRMSHAGMPGRGINPLAVMSRIVSRTEGLPLTGDGASAPTWLMLRDDKTHYNVSMPRSAFGCLSVMTFYTKPAEVLNRLHSICEEAFAECLAAREAAGVQKQSWTPRVMDWAQLSREAAEAGGADWMAGYDGLVRELAARIACGSASYADAYRALLEYACNALSDVPMVIYGLMPPYYPAVTNGNFSGVSRSIARIGELLAEYAAAHFDQPYETEPFYNGISDLSYVSAPDSADAEGTQRLLMEQMPMYGISYKLALEDMAVIAMPCINVGPWGKDFHKLTERVYMDDLFNRTPELLYQAIKTALDID